MSKVLTPKQIYIIKKFMYDVTKSFAGIGVITTYFSSDISNLHRFINVFCAIGLTFFSLFITLRLERQYE